jgi:hypothetical protein
MLYSNNEVYTPETAERGEDSPCVPSGGIA